MFTIAKATPVVTWATPADIVYGTALSTTQLNATANVAGSFSYTPARRRADSNAGEPDAVGELHADGCGELQRRVQNGKINVLKATPTVTVLPVSATFNGRRTGRPGPWRA